MNRPTGNDLTGKGCKRAAPDNVYRKEAREAKMAKLDSVKSFAEQAMRTDRRPSSEPLFAEQEDTKPDEDAAEGAKLQEEHEATQDGNGDEMQQELNHESRKLEDYTAYEIEEGLTRGTVAIQKLFLQEFAKIPRLSNGGHSSKDGSRILSACQKLQFENVVDALTKFFRAPGRKPNPIPSSCDVNDPAHLMRILREIDGFIQEPKVHFSQQSTQE